MSTDPSTLAMGQRLVARALTFYGLKEVAGPSSDPTILAWQRERFPATKDDKDIAWCGIFVAEVLEAEGIKPPTPSSRAASYEHVAQPVAGAFDAQLGDIVVFTRNGGNHVGFFVSRQGGAQDLWVLGGNQGDMVCIKSYPLNRLKAVRRYS